MTTTDWPVKARDVLTHHSDSRHWDGFAFRDGDVVIATYAKAGTTWMQQIVGQLIFEAREDVAVHQLSPWYDMRLLAPEARAAVAAQTHRRFLKTHLPLDALVFSPQARYIYVARDGRDTAWSFHHHHVNMTDEAFARFNTGLPEGYPLLERGTEDPLEFYRAWFTRNGFPVWPFWEHVRGWWQARHLPNVLLVHFNDLKADLPGNLRRIAAFLGIAPDEAAFARILAHCDFDYMKANAGQMAPRGGSSWKGGADTFINKGTNGRWRDRLTPEDVAAYEARALAELGPDCARWLAAGVAYA